MNINSKHINVETEMGQCTVMEGSNTTVQLDGPHISKIFSPHGDDKAGFLMTANKDYVVTTGLGDKSIKFWKMSELIKKESSDPVPCHEWKHLKKVTAITWVDFKLDGKDFSGILYSDKFGEVRFYNVKHVPTQQEESKEDAKDEKIENEEKENDANLLFGHQHIVDHLEVSIDQKYILTVDADKVKITHFPECVSIHSVTFHMMKKVTAFGTLSTESNDQLFYAYSDSEKWLKVWKVTHESTDLVADYKGDNLIEATKESIANEDKININKVEASGRITITYYKEKITKVVVFDIALTV